MYKLLLKSIITIIYKNEKYFYLFMYAFMRICYRLL
jgi:hypothetical protein